MLFIGLLFRQACVSKDIGAESDTFNEEICVPLLCGLFWLVGMVASVQVVQSDGFQRPFLKKKTKKQGKMLILLVVGSRAGLRKIGEMG